MSSDQVWLPLASDSQLFLLQLDGLLEAKCFEIKQFPNHATIYIFVNSTEILFSVVGRTTNYFY